MTTKIDIKEVAKARVAFAHMDLSEIFAKLGDPSEVSAPLPTVKAPELSPPSPFRAEAPIESASDALRFISAGKATLTLVSKKTNARFTFKVAKPKDGDGSVLFVSVLNGPDNWSNYAYFGYIRRGVFLYGGKKAKVSSSAPSAQAFAWAFEKLSRGEMPSNLEVWHEGKCGRCGFKLTVPSSIASGFGPECIGKI